MQLQNYASGQWVAGSGIRPDLLDAITGELIGSTSSGGSDPLLSSWSRRHARQG